MRYKDTSKGSIKNKKFYKTTYYKEVPEKNTDTYIISQAGDRLDSLAYRFYNNPKLWWFIARVNHLKTMNVSPGTELRIPINTSDAKAF